MSKPLFEFSDPEVLSSAQINNYLSPANRVPDLAEPVVFDTGWTTLPITAAGYSHSATAGTLQYRRVGQIVFLRGGVQKDNGFFPSDGTTTTVAVLPDTGLRPVQTHRAGVAATGQRAANVQAYANGDITLTPALNTTSASWIAASTSWVVG